MDNDEGGTCVENDGIKMSHSYVTQRKKTSIYLIKEVRINDIRSILLL
jgi:hypothetical protein